MKKKILFLTDELRVGGGETYFYKIENNVDRSIVDMFTGAKMGICYDKIKYKHKYTELSKGFLKKFKEIKEKINSEKINIVHANSLNLCILVVLIRLYTKGSFRILYTKHNLTTLEKINDRIFAFFINKYVDTMLTVSEQDKKNMIAKGINSERIVAIPNGVDISQFQFNPHYMVGKEILNIGILARLSEEKNHEFFLKITEELQNREIPFNAYIAGDGVLRDELLTIIKEKQLKVNMLGNLSEPEKFLSEMDIKILVSKREVFPMTILEAMCVGTIVVTIDVGGVRDCVLNEETGYVIDEYDTHKFAAIIEKIYRDRNEVEQIILNARKLIEQQFSMSKMIGRLVELYTGE